MNLLVSKVAEEETSGSGEGIEGEELVQWYLEQKEEELTGEEDYEQELALAKKVLKKMVKDNILMAIRGEGMQEDTENGQAGPSAAAQKTVYVLHPNCAVEDV